MFVDTPQDHQDVERISCLSTNLYRATEIFHEAYYVRLLVLYESGFHNF